MRRFALKEKTENDNDPLATKLDKKQRNHVANLSPKIKKDYFQKYILHGSSLRILESFVNHSLQIKPQTLTTKLSLWKRKSSHFSKSLLKSLKNLILPDGTL